MNSDDFASPTSPSASTSTGRRIRIRSLKRSLTSQEASLPSIPSDDNDWVSPFTLPPLPALRKNRSQVDRSPEDRKHDRSGSSAYYAAAWGSPYATPSPNQSPATKFGRNRSLDLQSSPLVSRDLDSNRSISRHVRRNSASAQTLAESSTDRSSSPSPGEGQKKSQRRNWLSESEYSESDVEKEPGKTPTQRRRVNDSAPSSARSHTVKESVDTITPETFNGASGITNVSKPPSIITSMAEANNESLSPALDDATLKEKPLPSLPLASPAMQSATHTQSRPQLPLPTQSFQRPKKKVPWKGKSCIIAMPLTDREQAGLPPVMSAREKQDRLQMWIDLGYPVHGFNVGDWYSAFSGVGGASRPSFPDASDMDMERKSTGPNVRIPDQNEWEAWVEYLKEEKLRALGVTPSTSEAPPSTHSPFSSTMSRVSSTYPSIAASPPIPSMSVASSHHRMSHSPFSPSMSIPASSAYSSLSQRGTPGLPNGSRPMHGYTQSIAIPGMGHRMNSPFEYPISQPGVYGAGVRSPAEQSAGRRPFSPGHVQNMQSMGHILSPVNLPQQDFARGFSPNPQIEQIRRQQEALARHQQQVQAQIVRAQHQRQMSMFPLRAMSTEQLPVTPKVSSPEREPPEIMHPTPRSHRHNLSAALEKGVTESVAVSSKELSEAVNGESVNGNASKESKDEVEEGEIVEEEAQEDLPILHRPETMNDADEKAEVETNPSIAGTPLLLDDKNPFSSFKPLPPPQPSTKRPGFGHVAQPSLSKLNVQAKEFSPSKATFSPSIFNFDGNAFADNNNNNDSERKISHVTKFSHKHNPSSLGLNVAAPAFTPSFAPNPAVSEQANSEVPRKLSAEDKTQHDASTKSNLGEDPNVSAFTFAPDKPLLSTPGKPAVNPDFPAYSFTGGKQQTSTPLKSETEPEPQSSAFSFRSATFNVEAPEFKPQGVSVSSIDFTPEKPKDFTNGTIFGDVVLDPLSKPTRRNKALPIVKPKSRDGTPEPDEKENFGADGRAEAPIDRNKRARHVEGDDKEVLFADSAPFTSLSDDIEPQTDRKDSATAVDSVDLETTGIPPKADTSAPAADTLDEQVVENLASDRSMDRDEVKEVSVDVKSTTDTAESVVEDGPAVRTVSNEISPEVINEGDNKDRDAIIKAPEEVGTAAARPSANGRGVSEGSREPIPEVPPMDDVAKPASLPDVEVAPVAEVAQPKDTVDETPKQTPLPALSAAAPAFKPAQSAVTDLKSGLSPFAPPFDFRPAAKESTTKPKSQTPEISSHDEAKKPRKGGLMASRFASSPPPAPATSMVLNSNPSPPKDTPDLLDELEEVPREGTSDVEATHTPSMETKLVEDLLDEVKSPEDPASTLAKFREDSRSGSVVSRAGDLSYEEINAVMKQFEDDPDLGIIREDTPVKSTPLIDMRFPRNFRSDAPSPSPRRLDRPFNRNQQRPYGGLGFDISGVHQLNYGSGEVSDWNADLSPGQQDKLEARANFFDDHVNDLVDNVLESRLAPLERALQNIQDSVQQVSSRPRASRRSMSTDNKESDADDEDDYDAYEGYSHYRSRSPHKRDRRQDRIKSAVIEALAVAQSNAEPTKIDTTLIEGTLQELRELAQKSAQQFPPKADLTEIQQALSELKIASQREVRAPTLDTSEISKYIEEMKALNQQRGSERQANFLAMQTTLNELRNLASEKPAPPVMDLSSIHAALAELKQQADDRPIPPQVDLSTVHRELAELRQQVSDKPVPPELDLSGIHSTLAELKQQTELRSKEAPSDTMKTVFEDVISTHPRLASASVDHDKENAKKLQVEIEGLKALLKSAEKRADGEAALRREAEEENDAFHRHLKDAQDQATTFKASAEEAKKNLDVFLQEKEDNRGLNAELRDVKLKNEALEKTLDEYRTYKEQMHDELNKERNRTDGLARALQDARRQHEDHTEVRDSLREQLGQLQQRMSKVMQDVHHDEAEWRKREHDFLSKNQLLQTALDHETNRRARMELESERLNKEHRENLQYKSKHETAQDEISRLATMIVGLQAENKTHQDAAFNAQKELSFLQEKTEDTIAAKVARLQDELEVSKSTLQTLQSDSDARVARLQGQLDNTTHEIQEQKSKHDQNMEKMFENHNRAVQEAEKRHAADLEQRLAFHEEKLVDLKAKYARDIRDAAEAKTHVEERYEDKLEISNDKIQHLESKVNDLQESLAVTKSAARAAVEAATAKGANLPTPASSVVASPPHRASISSASMPIARGSDLPEKISPQALRETIMVLQDQLQNREQKIDRLEAELAAIDKEAPSKVKERDTEIVMLRELLDVRVDDLQELIGTLEKPDYDQTAVKDAAIRLKTQIKMEQQLKERMISGAGLASNLPSSITSGLANLTQSPRAMVAAAAWGNWRKVRDSGIGAVSEFANNLGSQTPSRVSSASSSALNGILSPPGTKMNPPNDKSEPSAARPLAAAAAVRKNVPSSPSSVPRPLRAFNAQPRTLSGARPMARRGTNESRPGSSGSVIRAAEPSSMKVEPPSTPIQLKTESDFGDDVDDDASPLDGKNPTVGSDLEELVRSEQNAMKARSPRSPRMSRSSADGTRKAAMRAIKES